MQSDISSAAKSYLSYLKKYVLQIGFLFISYCYNNTSIVWLITQKNK